MNDDDVYKTAAILEGGPFEWRENGDVYHLFQNDKVVGCVMRPNEKGERLVCLVGDFGLVPYDGGRVATLTEAKAMVEHEVARRIIGCRTGPT